MQLNAFSVFCLSCSTMCKYPCCHFQSPFPRKRSPRGIRRFINHLNRGGTFGTLPKLIPAISDKTECLEILSYPKLLPLNKFLLMDLSSPLVRAQFPRCVPVWESRDLQNWGWGTYSYLLPRAKTIGCT